MKLHRMFFLALLGLGAVAGSTAGNPGYACWLPDGQGRYFLPRGYVTLTEDGALPVSYTADDYQRMLRYGANCQVVRLALGKLGGWPGHELQEEYLEQIDGMVRLAREAGMKTAFKMTVYGIKGFGKNKGWDKLLGSHGHQQQLAKAWETIWIRYKNDPSVFGYDLLNEPFRGSLDESYEQVTNARLIPLYRELIDRLQKTSPGKWAMYQPLLLDPSDRGPGKLPMVPMDMPIGRQRIIFAPHGYFPNAKLHVKAVERHLREAELSGARLMMGEWGRQTYTKNDASLEEQLKYQLLYAELASLFDSHHMGTIKPWFIGTRHAGEFTWAIFSDATATGSVERKFIVDVIARPFPLTVAGRVTSFGYDFTSRTLTVDLVPDRKRGPSEIFIGENRHYPDGFTVLYNGDVVLVYESDTKAPVANDSEAFRFDPGSQRLFVTRWPGTADCGRLEIKPGAPSKH